MKTKQKKKRCRYSADMREAIVQMYTAFEAEIDGTFRRKRCKSLRNMTANVQIATIMQMPLRTVRSITSQADTPQDFNYNKPKEIKKEGRTFDKQTQRNTLPKEIKNKRRKVILDSLDKQTIRNTIHQLYRQKELVTIDRLHSVLTNEKMIKASKSTIYLAVHDLGFRYLKKNGKTFLAERQDILLSRHAYLRKIKKMRQEGYEVVYVDELSINVHDSQQGEGPRAVILDAGSSKGSIDGVGLIFESKSDLADDHQDMNFSQWFKHKLVPALVKPSCIVLDNATYHNEKTEESKYPNRGWKKEAIIDWLKSKDVSMDDDDLLMSELLKLVNQNKPRQEFLLDRWAKELGHVVLRTPVRHSEFNPFECIWGRIKMHVKRQNTTFKMEDVVNLIKEARTVITADDWKKEVDKVINKVEPFFWELDYWMEDEVPDFIIEIGNEDEDDDNIDEQLNAITEAIPFTDFILLDEDDADGDNDDKYIADEDDETECIICDRRYPPPFLDELSPLTWVQCDFCDRWTHCCCANVKGPIPEKMDYSCNRCT